MHEGRARSQLVSIDGDIVRQKKMGGKGDYKFMNDIIVYLSRQGEKESQLKG